MIIGIIIHPSLSHLLFFLLIHRSGARFTHVWRRLLQAFVPEASFYFYSASSLRNEKRIEILYATSILSCACSLSSSLLKRVSVFVVVVDNIQGFPSSVTADYVPFQIWDLLWVNQAVSKQCMYWQCKGFLHCHQITNCQLTLTTTTSKVKITMTFNWLTVTL